MSTRVIVRDVVNMPTMTTIDGGLTYPEQVSRVPILSQTTRDGKTVTMTVDVDAYERFLERKRYTPIVSGLTVVPELNPNMFPHQRDVTSWALRLGRSAA